MGRPTGKGITLGKKRMGGYWRDRAVRSRKRKIRDLNKIKCMTYFSSFKGRVFSHFSIRDENLQRYCSILKDDKYVLQKLYFP